jgi:anti-sigma B factor antagonist
MNGYGRQSEITVADPVEGVCVVTVACEIDLLTARTLQQILARELGAGHQAVLVDLSECEFMGSAGLAALVASRGRARTGGTTFALAGMNSSVARSIEATGLDPLFEIYPRAEDAAAALGGR